jgi:hypothetical protein
MKDHRDPNDILREDGVEALRAEFDSMKPFEQGNGSNGHRHHNRGDDFGVTQDEPPLEPGDYTWRDNTFTAATLRTKQFKVIQYVVPGLFPEGLADVFDNKAPEGARPDLFRLIRGTPELDWQLVTKLPRER